MRLKITLRRPAGEVDLVVTADATASVTDVARHIATADPTLPEAPAGLVTLLVRDPLNPTGRLLDGASGVVDCGIRSGSRLEVAQPYRRATSGSDPVAAIARVVSGLDVGKEFPLREGANLIGRQRDLAVCLADPLVSKRHAKITVADTIEITDLNSANGVLMSGEPVTRATLTSSDVVVLGDTTLTVSRLPNAGRVSGPVLEHVRSPRVVPPYPGREFPLPKPPGVPQAQRFPLIAMAAPLMLGGVMYAIQPQGLAVIMMLMTPLLLISSWMDQSITSRRVMKNQKRQFDQSMLRMQERLEAERETERRVRGVESPSLAEAEQAVEQLSPLLWTRRPEHVHYLTIRLGRGRASSRNTLVLPQSNETLPEFWEQLEDLRAEFGQLDDVPIIADLHRDGALGVAGPHGVASGVARGIVLQLLALHSPAEVV
ncbi:MAG: FHA domain-containing protein, partial [Micropruina sp.]